MDEFLKFLAVFGLDMKSLIEIFMSITSVVISVMAILHSRKSIKLTEKSIYEANRPVVSVYIDHISVYSAVHEYLVIKNFGSTPAQITSLSFSADMPVTHIDNTSMFSEYGMPFLLAPNQSFSTILRIDALAPSFKTETDIYHGKFTVRITYTDNIKVFEEEFIINQDLVKNLRVTKSNASKNTTTTKALLHASEEILRKTI